MSDLQNSPYAQYPQETHNSSLLSTLAPVAAAAVGVAAIAHQRRPNGLAITGLVFAVIGFPFAFVPYWGIFVAGPGALLGLVFSLLGLFSAFSRLLKGLPIAIMGLSFAVATGIMMLFGGGRLW